MTIRAIAGCDLEKCAEVITSAFRTVADEFGITESNCPTHPAFATVASLRAMQERGITFFGLHDSGELLGCVALERADDSVWFLERLAVLPQSRHAGLGKKLMEFAFDHVRGHGGRVVSIGVINENMVLKNWYASLGFTETGVKSFPHLPFAVSFMEKTV